MSLFRCFSAGWSTIETAPLPEHYADFARLAATVARRYPDVRHFQVWNEFKGFWDAPNNWHYRHYTRRYVATSSSPDVEVLASAKKRSGPVAWVSMKTTTPGEEGQIRIGSEHPVEAQSLKSHGYSSASTKFACYVYLFSIFMLTLENISDYISFNKKSLPAN